MTGGEAPRQELEQGLAYVDAKLAELQCTRQRYRDALAALKQEQHLRCLGGRDWSYEATEVGTGTVHTGTVVATDLLNAVHRANQRLPHGIGYSVRVHPPREETP